MPDLSKNGGKEQDDDTPSSSTTSYDMPVQDKEKSQEVPSLLALNGFGLPAEIVSYVLSYYIGDGLQISNNPALDSDMSTIRTLLKTSTSIKHEVLRHIFSRPLCIYITNGKLCGCKQIIKQVEGKPVSTLLLKKISHLPLQKWSAMTMFFAPGSQERACAPDRRGRWDSIDRWVDYLEPENQDSLGWKFIHAVDCVIRQSRVLGDALRERCRPEQRKHLHKLCWNRYAKRWYNCVDPTIFCYDPPAGSRFLRTKFVFHDPAEQYPEYNRREVPLWEMNMVFDLLSPWRWTSVPDDFRQIQFPPTIVLCLWNWDSDMGR